MTQPSPWNPPGSEPGSTAGGPPPPPPPGPGQGYPGPQQGASQPTAPNPYAQPGGAYPQGGPHASAGPPPQPTQPRGLSITAFVLGLLGCLPLASIAAIVVGIVALVKKQALRGLAIAGIILGLLWTIGGIAFFATGAAPRLVESVQEAADGGSSESGETGSDGEVIESSDLGLGDCFDDPTALEAPSDEAFVSGELVLLACDQPHAFEVYHISAIAGAEYPGEDAVLVEVDQVCLDAFADFVGLPYAESVIEVIYYYPTQSTWTGRDDRSIICAASDGESTTGSLRDANR